jgi:glycosyltransferase involved in cell wall biosynthesis
MAPRTDPLVSVIVPVFNGARFLREAVASVRRQRYAPIEIIVVDDGSTDATRPIAAELEQGGDVRYVHQANAGPPAARNTGLRSAAGSVIGFLDVDDLWTEEKLAIQVGHLTRDPSLDVILGYTEVTHLPGSVSGGGPPRSGPLIQLGAALMRRTAFDRIGWFDETLYHGDDFDWFMRAKEAGLSVRVHPDVVQFYRRHEGNLTNQREVDRRFFLSTLKKSLDRRRQAGAGTVQPLEGWLEPPRS